jgi:hypothetical protein
LREHPRPLALERADSGDRHKSHVPRTTHGRGRRLRLRAARPPPARRRWTARAQPDHSRRGDAAQTGAARREPAAGTAGGRHGPMRRADRRCRGGRDRADEPNAAAAHVRRGAGGRRGLPGPDRTCLPALRGVRTRTHRCRCVSYLPWSTRRSRPASRGLVSDQRRPGGRHHQTGVSLGRVGLPGRLGSVALRAGRRCRRPRPDGRPAARPAAVGRRRGHLHGRPSHRGCRGRGSRPPFVRRHRETRVPVAQPW